MTSLDLARSYLKKAEARVDILEVLYRKAAYSDVVREAQEVVELALKGALRFVGIEPPKYHDVGPLLVEHRDRLAKVSRHDVQKAAEISKKLRKEREFSFYGDIDFIPTEEYTSENAQDAIKGAKFVLELVKNVVV
ncbi:MAG: HEPN domain-containing protein [Spirochaetota bacterium]